VALSQFRHKLREEFSAAVDVTVREANCNVSYSVEGTAAHKAEITAAYCPTGKDLSTVFKSSTIYSQT
jgi:hypothetical protein